MNPCLVISARTLVTALCLGLSLVFAGATSASVVDRVQHGAQIEHGHAGAISFSITAADHDADHAVPGDQDDDDGANPVGHQPGSGHHHADAPAGVLGSVIAAAGSTVCGVAGVRQGNPGVVRGVKPGGLERPPKQVVQPV